MTPAEFLMLGHTNWIEVHWTLARTDEQAREYLEHKGIENVELYRMCYPNKKTDGFFGYWAKVI